MSSVANQTENTTDYNNETAPVSCTGVEWIPLYWFYMSIACTVGSLTGNSLVMAVVFRNKGMRKTMNYFIVCMSASDIFVPVFSLLHDIFFELRYGGEMERSTVTALCKFIPFFLNLSAAVSVWCLVAIAVHRFYVVMFPFRALREIGRRKTCLLICLIWLLGLAMISPLLYFFDIVIDNGTMVCTYTGHEVFNTVHSVLFRAVPLIIMAVIYVIIIHKLRRQKPVGNSYSAREERRRKQQSVLMTKMSIAVVFAFVFCMGANEVLFMLYAKYTDSCAIFRGLLVAQAFIPLSAVLNPIIYFIYCKNYRSGLRAVFTRRTPGSLSLNTIRLRFSRPSDRTSSSTLELTSSRHSYQLSADSPGPGKKRNNPAILLQSVNMKANINRI